MLRIENFLDIDYILYADMFILRAATLKITFRFSIFKTSVETFSDKFAVKFFYLIWYIDWLNIDHTMTM